MISKKEFVNIINRLKEVNDFVDETNTRARALTDAIKSEMTNAMHLAINHEDIVVELLENIFNDNDIISWWLYELDYGREFKEGYLQDGKGYNIDISSAEKLYDYLLGVM